LLGISSQAQSNSIRISKKHKKIPQIRKIQVLYHKNIPAMEVESNWPGHIVEELLYLATRVNESQSPSQQIIYPGIIDKFISPG
jgi:hypothetical protein